ncbi:MAG: phytoene/squalene synthase family protein [Halobacteriota archaeon]
MVDDEQLARSKAIQQRTGKTFHVATRLLPQRIREATYVLYAFFRVADEVVDDAGDATPAEQRAELSALRTAVLGDTEPEDPILAAFFELRNRHGIADEDVETFIDAMRADTRTSRYDTYAELESYMDGSAAAVGRMMTAVMDPDDPEAALPHATALGEAFQLTNFLRDVREDVVDRDRIYLPQSTLAEHGVTEAEIERLEMSPRFAAAMRAELRRAERLYQEGVAGIKYLPNDCQLAVLCAAVLYADHHRLIRDRDYDVLSSTPTLGTLRKLRLLAKTRWRWIWSTDPEAVFSEVSGIGSPESRSHGPEPIETLPTQ